MSVATELAVDYYADVDTDFDAPPPGLRVAGRPTSVPSRRPVSARPVRPATVSILRAPGSPAELAPVRLTRRGVVVLAGAVALLGAALVWLASASAPAATPAPAAGPATVTVQSGDTLWSIASRVAPQVDPRAEVGTLQRLNHLASVALVPGQQLRVR